MMDAAGDKPEARGDQGKHDQTRTRQPRAEAGRALVLWTALQSDVAHRPGDEKALLAGHNQIFPPRTMAHWHTPPRHTPLSQSLNR